MIKSNEDPVCPVCGERLSKKDWVKRVKRKADGEKEWMLIERRRCTNESCLKTHRLLPDEVIPNKYYEAGAIEDVIDGTFDEDALSEEDRPSESTLQRWRRWSREFIRDAEGHLRSAAYRTLGLSKEFLGTGESLLIELKERLDYGWLAAAMRIYVNAG